MLWLLLDASRALGERAERMPEGRRALLGAAALVLVAALAGAVEASAPGGMYY